MYVQFNIKGKKMHFIMHIKIPTFQLRHVVHVPTWKIGHLKLPFELTPEECQKI